MKDIDKLNKYELLKLLKKKGFNNKKKKKVKAKNTRTKKTYSHSHNPNMSDNMVQHKPIITHTNAHQPGRVITQPVGAQSMFGSTSSVDQRNNDIMRGEMNKTSNQMIVVSNELKKARSEAQLFGDEKKTTTAYIKRKKKQDPEYMPIFLKNPEVGIKLGGVLNKLHNEDVGEPHSKLAGAFNKLKWVSNNTKAKPTTLTEIVDTSIGRDTHEDTNFFSPTDNIDVPTTSIEFEDDIDIDADENEEKENYVDEKEIITPNEVKKKKKKIVANDDNEIEVDTKEVKKKKKKKEEMVEKVEKVDNNADMTKYSHKELLDELNTIRASTSSAAAKQKYSPHGKKKQEMIDLIIEFYN